MPTATLGRYRIVKELGRGAMGRVFLAHDPTIDRRVAIKTVQVLQNLPEHEREAARRRFLEEARAAGALSHPGIVTVFDADVVDGVPFIAMEHLDGTALDHYCRPDNLLPVDVVVELIAAAAEALDFAHRKRIVHRDIKPGNLMRTGDRSVKIMDFGLARAGEARAARDKAIFGTPSFMSPEQIRGEPLDGRSDLFSLAAVLYQLLSGEKAFSGDSVSSVIYRVVHEDPRDASTISERVPVGLGAFLKRALAKDRARRFPTGGAFAAALREAARGLGETPPRPVASGADVSAGAGGAEPLGPLPTSEDALPPPPSRRRPSSRRSARAAWWSVLGVLLIAAAAGAAWWYREPLMALLSPAPPQVWLETRVRTDPPGLPVMLDGEPLDNPTVRFDAAGPFGELTVTQGCRTTSHRLDPADGGGEVVLVPDPTEVEIAVNPTLTGATVQVNGEKAEVTPARLTLDLCRENRVTLAAKGYRSASAVVPRGATPLEARTAVAALSLEPIPRGLVELPAPPYSVAFYLDGDRVERGDRPIEVLEGEHALRMVSSRLWVDVTQTLTVAGGQTLRPELELPALATLVVQAFPANCKVYLRRAAGGAFEYLDETPLTRQLAAGDYRVKVEFKPTGEDKVVDISLAPGRNAPVRVSFSRGSS